MANLLANPGLWHVDFDAPPPSSWNGSAYEISVSSGTTAIFQLLYNGGSQPAPGDVIAGSITYTATDGLPPGNTPMMVLYDPLNGDVLASQPISYGTPSEFSFDASAYPTDAWLETGLNGVRLLLEVSNAPATGFPAYLYGLQLSVTPTAVPEPVVEACQEIGRATRNYLSAYQRDRVFRASLYAAEKRCLVTNFNGAIQPGRSIVSATWQTWDTSQCVMSSPAISGREVQVTVAAQYAGNCRIRVDATLDNGEVYSAWHVIRVQPAPYFNNPGWVTGPSSLTVSV
jgi:hypothetical protein